jgi:hypothetical protein
MRYRVILVLLLLSLLANLVLATAWRRALKPTAVYRLEPPPRRALVTNVLRPIRTNLVFQPRLLSWRDIESDDYPTYIRNLRSVGCPEETIRDIVVADVNELFAHRRATEVVSPNQQWWVDEPDLDLLDQAMEAKDALEAERRDLLTQLLGPRWDVTGTATEVAGSAITLDGPLLGELPAESKRALREIEFRSRERLRAHAQAMREQGKGVDPAEYARVRKELREELGKVLTPAQMEEYLLRYSDNAAQLRRSLGGFDATPEEFRNMFRVADGYDLELAALAGATDATSARRRQELEAKRDEAMRSTLGNERYAYYRLNQDPVFRQAREAVEQVGAPAEAVLPLYQITQETERERRRILNDPTLTPDQQSEELAAVDQARMSSLRRVLGEERFRRFEGGTTR